MNQNEEITINELSWITNKAVHCVCFAVFLSLMVSGDLDADAKCENIYKDFSDCVLELGDSMDNYQENVTSETGVAAVCRWW